MLVVTLIYSVNNANGKIDNFFLLHKKVANIISTNKDFDIFMSSNFDYNNFDYIQEDIRIINKEIDFIDNDELFKTLSNKSLHKSFELIKDNIKTKVSYINRIISKSAVLNNSFRYIQNMQASNFDKDVVEIYTGVMGLDHNAEIKMHQLQEKIETFNAKNSQQELFISHARIIVEYYNTFDVIKSDAENLKLAEKLFSFENGFTNHSTNIMRGLKDVIWLLMILLFIALVVFLYYIHQMTLKQIELNRFKKAVENSDNIVVITDAQQRIRYVNESFEKTTGYQLFEVIGQTPAVLKSGKLPISFYEKLNDTIYAGEKWTGEFINKNKNGHLSYEKASITPIINEKGEIEEFLAIKLDITKEKETQELLKEKEHILAQQSKMIAMREMLESIAHQWRQPLSTISTAASGMKLNKEFDTLDDERFEEFMDVIVDNTIKLSNTVDNFKNYFNTNNEMTTFSLKGTVGKVIDLVGYRLNDDKIEVSLHGDDATLEGLENEFIQALVNIINNAQEALHTTEYKHKHIFIETKKRNDNYIELSIKDNGGGVDESIMDKVFEPYFTTKHEASGTGVGLYMSYEIVVKHFNGTIQLTNTEYDYDENSYKGVEVTINVPACLHNIESEKPI